MSLTLGKDSSGKFIAPSEEDMSKALDGRGGVPKKHNSAKNSHSVLLTTLKEAEKLSDSTLEELGL